MNIELGKKNKKINNNNLIIYRIVRLQALPFFTYMNIPSLKILYSIQ